MYLLLQGENTEDSLVSSLSDSSLMSHVWTLSVKQANWVYMGIAQGRNFVEFSNVF